MKVNYTSSDAVFSDDRVYRYALHRSWEPCTKPGFVLWILLNPSTADEKVLDPTLRRCQHFTWTWGFGAFFIVNLYAFRSTKPKVLWTVRDPVGGPNNDLAIVDGAKRAALVVGGWGTNAQKSRQYDVWKMLESHSIQIQCLGFNKNGSPEHPLYIPSGTPLQPWPRPRSIVIP